LPSCGRLVNIRFSQTDYFFYGLSFALKKQDYEITVARTTLEADALWEKKEYDLAVLDVSLPDGSGFDFCKKNKADIKNAHYVPHCR